MKKLLVLMASILAFNTAQAEDVTFTGTAASTCTITVTQAGTLNLSGTTIATATDAQGEVVNNEAGAFNLYITSPTAFATKPNSFTGTPTMSSSYDLSGVNTIAEVTGFVTLTNAGTDALYVDLTGTTDTPLTAGSYSAVTVLTCVAP